MKQTTNRQIRPINWPLPSYELAHAFCVRPMLNLSFSSANLSIQPNGCAHYFCSDLNGSDSEANKM